MRKRVVIKWCTAIIIFVVIAAYIPKVSLAASFIGFDGINLLFSFVGPRASESPDTDMVAQDTEAYIDENDNGEDAEPAAGDVPATETTPGTDENGEVFVPDPDFGEKDNYLPPGEDLSYDADYIVTLREIYSEEDMKRLYAPRKMVTVPDVVGMTEAKALETMRALGLIVRVVYEDASRGEDGKVFAQEFAGYLHNTDASLFIWVKRIDKNQLTNDKFIMSESPSFPETTVHPEAAVTAPESVSTDMDEVSSSKVVTDKDDEVQEVTVENNESVEPSEIPGQDSSLSGNESPSP